MMQNYKVVTLCGSTRFKEQFLEAQKRLTLDGCIVISVGLFGHSCVPLVASDQRSSAGDDDVEASFCVKQAANQMLRIVFQNSALSLQTFLLSLQQITA